MRRGFWFLRIVFISKVYKISDCCAMKYEIGRTVFMYQPDRDSKKYLFGRTVFMNQPDRDSKKYLFGRTVFMNQPDRDSKRIHLVGLATSKNPTRLVEGRD